MSTRLPLSLWYVAVHIQLIWNHMFTPFQFVPLQYLLLFYCRLYQLLEHQRSLLLIFPEAVATYVLVLFGSLLILGEAGSSSESWQILLLLKFRSSATDLKTPVQWYAIQHNGLDTKRCRQNARVRLFHLSTFIWGGKAKLPLRSEPSQRCVYTRASPFDCIVCVFFSSFLQVLQLLCPPPGAGVPPHSYCLFVRSFLSHSPSLSLCSSGA